MIQYIKKLAIIRLIQALLIFSLPVEPVYAVEILSHHLKQPTLGESGRGVELARFAGHAKQIYARYLRTGRIPHVVSGLFANDASVSSLDEGLVFDIAGFEDVYWVGDVPEISFSKARIYLGQVDSDTSAYLHVLPRQEEPAKGDGFMLSRVRLRGLMHGLYEELVESQYHRLLGQIRHVQSSSWIPSEMRTLIREHLVSPIPDFQDAYNALGRYDADRVEGELEKLISDLRTAEGELRTVIEAIPKAALGHMPGILVSQSEELRDVEAFLSTMLAQFREARAYIAQERVGMGTHLKRLRRIATDSDVRRLYRQIRRLLPFGEWARAKRRRFHAEQESALHDAEVGAWRKVVASTGSPSALRSLSFDEFADQMGVVRLSHFHPEVLLPHPMFYIPPDLFDAIEASRRDAVNLDADIISWLVRRSVNWPMVFYYDILRPGVYMVPELFDTWRVWRWVGKFGIFHEYLEEAFADPSLADRTMFYTPGFNSKHANFRVLKGELQFAALVSRKEFEDAVQFRLDGLEILLRNIEMLGIRSSRPIAYAVDHYEMLLDASFEDYRKAAEDLWVRAGGELSGDGVAIAKKAPRLMLGHPDNTDARLGHTDLLHDIAFSPDGKLLATSSDDGTARIWDANTGRQLFVLEGHEEPVYGIAFSPDGERLATSSQDKTIRIWRVADGQLLSTLWGHKEHPMDDPDSFFVPPTIFTVAFSPDGRKLVSASEDRTARIWDIGAETELLILNPGFLDDAWVRAADFFPDGERVITVSSTKARIWDAETGEARGALEGDINWASDVAISPDSRLIALPGYEHVLLFDVRTRDRLSSYRGHVGWAHSVDFHPSSQLLVSSDNEGVYLWDTSPEAVRDASAAEGVGGQPLHVLELGETFDAKFSPNGSRIAVAKGDHTAVVWMTEDILSRPDAEGRESFKDKTEVAGDGLRENTYRSIVPVQIPGVTNAHYVAAGSDIDPGTQLIRRVFPNVEAVTVSDTGYTIDASEGPGQRLLWRDPPANTVLLGHMASQQETPYLLDPHMGGDEPALYARPQAIDQVTLPPHAGGAAAVLIRRPGKWGKLSGIGSVYSEMVPKLTVGDFLLLSDAMMPVNIVAPESIGLQIVSASGTVIPGVRLPGGQGGIFWWVNRDERSWVVFQKVKHVESETIQAIIRADRKLALAMGRELLTTPAHEPYGFKDAVTRWKDDSLIQGLSDDQRADTRRWFKQMSRIAPAGWKLFLDEMAQSLGRPDRFHDHDWVPTQGAAGDRLLDDEAGEVFRPVGIAYYASDMSLPAGDGVLHVRLLGKGEGDTELVGPRMVNVAFMDWSSGPRSVDLEGLQNAVESLGDGLGVDVLIQSPSILSWQPVMGSSVRVATKWVLNSLESIKAFVSRMRNEHRRQIMEAVLLDLAA